MNSQEIQALSDEQLVHNELQLERDLLAASFRLRTGQLEDTAGLGRIRRDIARLRTAQRSRERAQGLNKDALRNQHRATFQAKASGSGAGASGSFVKGLVDKMGSQE